MSRSNRMKANYIGYYNQKRVSQIGCIDLRVICENGQFTNEQDGKEVDKETLDRITQFINEIGWNLEGDRIFISNEMHEINMRKESKGGIQGARYININDHIKDQSIEKISLKEIAKNLKDQVVWSK